MAVDFCDYFWGEEHNGWNVLYQNMKQGQTASKELAEFFKERWSIDETYSKSLVKLANKASTNTEKGTCAPIFVVLRQSSEKLSNIHSHTVQRVQDLVKEVVKYSDDLHKKQKGVKDEESQTEEIVKTIQTTSGLAQKARETYSQRCQDLEKVRRDGASPKDVEKAEAKLRKAHDEYRGLVEKYNNIREEFEKRMTTSCMKFQTVEEAHLAQMLQFVQTYINLLQSNHEAMGQIHQDLLNQYSQFSIERLLDQFALSKHTGLEKPNPMLFEDAGSLGSAVSGQQSPEPEQSKSSLEEGGGGGGGGSSSGGGVLTGGFLRSRRDKKKEKKTKKKKDNDSSSNKEEKSDNETNDDSGTKVADIITPSVTATTDGANSTAHTPSVDEEGFSVRPEVNKKSGNDNSFDSSSDSDSDADIDRKIHVEIKPISNGNPPMSASVDELRATIEGMSLSAMSFPSPRVPPRQLSSEGKIKIRYLTLQKTRRTSTDAQESFPPMKRSNSITQQLSGGSKTSSADLLGLNFNFSGNSESSPKALNKTLSGDTSLTRPMSPATNSLPGRSSPASFSSVTSPVMAPPPRADRYAELSDILNEVGDAPPALPPRTGGSSSRGSTPTPTMAIPRPPSRKALEGPSPRGRQSPSTVSGLSHADSVSSLEFRTSGMVGTSRGPSPLTIGLSDSIPLAVAFQELCHAYFRGTDDSKCQVKVTGEMMVSFPAGIVNVLTNNPSPAQLSFKVNNFSKVSNVLPNKQLINVDSDQSTPECGVFSFNMNALTSLLRKQAESNPSASYFNVDMIKYQQVSPLNGAQSSPLQLVAYWKCEDGHTDLRIDYKYNPYAIATPCALLNVNITVPVDGVVKNMQSKPSGQWLKDQQRAVWKLTELSQHSASGGVGSLRAKFEVAAGPSTPATVSAQFNCEGTTMSGLDFALSGSGYRVSLVKKRFVSGKYICDADAVLRLRYGSIPS
ncbi:F-BAR domain only protein 2 isoform X5 [Palaemon carinicauda]|uniref:F-BAR domain only protein 2 isoform X5 n=1 Tax=Palaemon carinicauda TaxID=392227 RepID=UPI0035B60625